jgi:glyoxylase-like metal-dependent hydrolase (beta-lactamase superfamily II)
MPPQKPAGPLQINVIVSPPFMENTWIVRRTGSEQCVLVDPGFTPRQIIQFLEKQNLTPQLILLTHGHADHIAGNQALKERWPELPIVIGAGDAPMLSDPVANLSGLGGVRVTSPPADRLLKEGDLVDAAGLSFEVFDVPGHSPGHVVYVLRGDLPLLVVGGDVLFAGSIGRCDFPGGDQELLVSGIRQKLFCLPDETEVFPGHGDPTTIGKERRTNPFCGDNAGLFDLE